MSGKEEKREPVEKHDVLFSQIFCVGIPKRPVFRCL